MMLSQAWALPSQNLESIEYLEHQGSAAIEIGFSESLQYLSHFPLRAGTTLRIFVGPRVEVDLSVDSLPYTQAMRAPRSKEIPLSQVTFKINEAGEASVIVDFERVVKFLVSPGRRPNMLLIKLPDHKISTRVQIQRTGITQDKSSPAYKLLALGRTALKKGDNKRAIQIFTKMLGLPASKERQEALELLGVSRQRNGQHAHAKAMYREYLKQYADTDGAARVKQRLSDLLHGQLKPKERLKVSKKAGKKTTSRFYGSFAQYYYRGQNSTEETGTTLSQSLLLNQLSLSWRIRSTDYDVRNFIYASHSHDFLSTAGKPVTPQTAYSQIKNSRLGFSARLGRQTGSKGGVLGKFDGLQASYDVAHSISVNAVGGYPVNFTDKRSVQTTKPFWGVGLEFDGGKSQVDVLPYYIRQDVDGIVDREAVGSEFRYFGKGGNFYSLVDYDIAYSDLNIYLFRGQYNWRKDTIFSLNFDYRNSPLLFTSNALIGRTDVSSIDELLAILPEDEIRDRAEERIGDATTLSIGVGHTFSPRYQANADLTMAQQVFVIEDPVLGLSSDTEVQVYFSAQLIASRWFNERDISVLGFRMSQTGSYDEVSLSVSNRLPFRKDWKFDTRFRVDIRQNDSGEELTKYRPSIRMNYRRTRGMNFEMELGVELWRYGGETNNIDFQRTFANIGYRWNF